ncbi:MAG: energy transducer TonB, partial [Verrucomicrobia bacterium]
IEVSVIKSTGSQALNRCAVEALKRWIFRPNFVSRVRVPIAFTL